MARKRMIDPEFWLDEDMTSMGFDCRLFYIGLWNFSDDYGVIGNSPKKVKAQIFPYEKIDVAPFIKLLIEMKKLIPFEAEGKQWLFVKNFPKYQRVDKPSKHRNPPVPKEILAEHSPSTQEPLHDEEKRSEVKRSKEKNTTATELPIWLDKKSWDKWVKYRKERRKALVPSTVESQLEFLKKHKKDHAEIINKSIDNGWTGLFELKPQGTSPPRQSDYARAHEKRIQNEDDARAMRESERENENLRKLNEDRKRLALEKKI